MRTKTDKELSSSLLCPGSPTGRGNRLRIYQVRVQIPSRVPFIKLNIKKEMKTIIICPRCKHLAYYNSYFKAYLCEKCYWMEYI